MQFFIDEVDFGILYELYNSLIFFLFDLDQKEPIQWIDYETRIENVGLKFRPFQHSIKILYERLIRVCNNDSLQFLRRGFRKHPRITICICSKDCNTMYMIHQVRHFKLFLIFQIFCDDFRVVHILCGFLKIK